MDTRYNRSAIRFSRIRPPAKYGAQSYAATITATTPDGSASTVIQATWPPPQLAARYPVPSPSLSLLQQRARAAWSWFADAYPPQGFENFGTHLGRDDVLALAVGPEGQPAARMATTGDSSLAEDRYNTQGRRYAMDVPIGLPPTLAVTATASLYVPRDWVDAAPGTAGCLDGAGCGRSTEFAVEIGLQTGGAFSPTFYAHMGFDNRAANLSSTGPYLYLAVDGPLIDQNGTAGVWPKSPLGSQLSFAFPNKYRHPAETWAGVLRTDDWNDFTFTVRRRKGDWGVMDGVNRGCVETMTMEW